MANDKLLTDDYVAGILARDAQESAIKYSALGLEAFSSQSKPPASKPKPNTRFLRNIIKETDSHNATLLAREAADSRARLQSLGRNAHREEQSTRVGGGDIRRRQLGDIAAILGGKASKRKRNEPRKHASKETLVYMSSEDEQQALEIAKGRRREYKSRHDGTEYRGSRHTDGEDKRKSDNSTQYKNHRRRHRGDSEDRGGDDRKRHKRSNSGDRAKDKNRIRHRSRSPKNGDSTKSRHRSGSTRRNGSEPSKAQSSHHFSKESKHEQKPDYDSDPLDDIIGPRPLAVPEVRSRGRGTISQASGIDSRFSALYDPAVDIELDPDEENDWDQALEALRDRQKWKQQGADRLRAAGFTDEEISKWEKGREEREEDVKWAKKGEGREWDRGKVVDSNGVFTSSANWGRLDRDTSNGDDVVESSWGRLKGT